MGTIIYPLDTRNDHYTNNPRWRLRSIFHSQITDTYGNFNFNLWDVFDVKRGQVVTVSDGVNTKTHTVMPLYVDGVNVTTDTVFGRADTNANVDIWVHGDGNQTAIPDGSGNWTADFSGQTDLTYLSDGGSQQMDEDGDVTGVWWASPSFHVAPRRQLGAVTDFGTPGASITLTIESSGGVVFSHSQTADTRGNFNFSNLLPVDLDTGYVVTISDGTIIKTHTVTDVNVAEIDTDTDQIHGTATPGARVWVWVYLFNDGSGRTAIADNYGNLMADLSMGVDGQLAYILPT